MSTTRTVTAHTFAASTDEQIIEACREILAACESAGLRPWAAKILRAKRPDVMDCGPIVWAHLCGWRQTWLK